MRNLFFKLLPSEKALLAFLAYAAVRLFAGPSFSFAGHHWATFPSVQICMTILFAMALKLVRQQKNHWLTAAVLILGCFALWSTPAFRAVFSVGIFFLLAVVYRDILRSEHRPFRVGPLIDECRKWWALLIMLCLYPLIPIILSSSRTPDLDGLLASVDRALFFGRNPLLLFESVISLPLSEWMAFSYLAYGFLILILLGVFYIREDQLAFRKYSLAVTLALTLGYFGYTWVPAIGPCFTETFHVPIRLRFMSALKIALVDQPRIDRDCFPSLHTCITLISGWAAWKYARPLFWFFSPILLTIPFACVYLRYHYVIDVLAGGLLAVLVVGLISHAHLNLKI